MIRAAAIVQWKSSSVGRCSFAIAVPGLGKKFWMMTSCTWPNCSCESRIAWRVSRRLSRLSPMPTRSPVVKGMASSPASRRVSSRRSGFFIAGLIGAALVTLTDIGRYSPVLFSVHMAQHTMLNMLTPLLLALGAPLALALENSRLRGTGVAGPLQWFATSRAFAVATKPVVALGVYTLGLFGLYFSPAFPWLMGGHLGHELMLVFFLVTGYLFYASILALDPLPSHPTLRVRLLEVVLGMVVQWIFGVVVMLAPIAVSGGWFRTVQPPWLTNLHRDQFVGGGIAAMSTQICDGIIVMFALLLVGRSRPTRKSSATISPDADVRG